MQHIYAVHLVVILWCIYSAFCCDVMACVSCILLWYYVSTHLIICLPWQQLLMLVTL